MLTEYTGTVPDTAVKNVIPSASGDFDATYTVTEDGELREVVLTGAFYGADGGAERPTRSASTTTARSRTSPRRDADDQPMTAPATGSAAGASSRLLLTLAAVAVAFAAADTYVVVLALPDMMRQHRHPDRRAAAGGADRLRLPARATSRCCR